MTLRVGILGAGDMGKIHAGILRSDRRVHVVGVADTDTERAHLLAAPSKAKPLASLEDLLREKIDILFVTSPNFTHCKTVVAALKKNIHVFSEKPMALNLAEGLEILDAANTSRGLYQLGFNRRFAPAYLAVKERINKGFIPYVADIKMNEGEMTSRDWITNVSKTGGYLNENTLHFLDMVQWLQGPIREIFAVGRKNIYKDMTDFVITLVTQNDRLASISTSGHATWFYPWERMEVLGDHEALITEEVEKTAHSPGLRQEIRVKDFFQLTREKKWGYEDEVKAFINAVANGGASAYGAEMGFEILQLVAACYQSVESGQKVVLPPRKKGSCIRGTTEQRLKRLSKT